MHQFTLEGIDVPKQQNRPLTIANEELKSLVLLLQRQSFSYGVGQELNKLVLSLDKRFSDLKSNTTKLQHAVTTAQITRFQIPAEEVKIVKPFEKPFELAVWGSTGGFVTCLATRYQVPKNNNQQNVNKLKEQLEKEFKIINSAGRHPWVHRVIGYTVADTMSHISVSILREMMDCSLTSFVRMNKLIPMERKIRLMRMMATGLHYLHSVNKYKKEQVLHRNVSPNNFLISKDLIKISGFGLAQIMTSSGTFHLSGGFKGDRFSYVAPEILSPNAKYSVYSDVYSLSMCFYYLLFQTEPFTTIHPSQLNDLKSGKLRPVLSTDNVPLTSLTFTKKQFGEVLKKLFVMIQSCWNPNPTERWSTKRILECLINLEKNLKGVDGLSVVYLEKNKSHVFLT